MGLLSARAARARISASAAAAQRARELRAAGKSIIELAQGEPDFNTPDHVIEAAYRAMYAGQTHYTPVDGTPELKAAIAAKFRRENGLECKPENISAGAGGKQVLYNALMATLDPGDEVLIPAPSWVAYADITHFAEGTPKWLPTRAEDGFKLRPHAVTPGLSFDLELAPLCLAADEDEAQEGEGLRLAEPAPLAVGRRIAAKLNQAGLVRM